jgi:hypothetical protein
MKRISAMFLVFFILSSIVSAQEYAATYFIRHSALIRQLIPFNKQFYNGLYINYSDRRMNCFKK